MWAMITGPGRVGARIVCSGMDCRAVVSCEDGGTIRVVFSDTNVEFSIYEMSKLFL